MQINTEYRSVAPMAGHPKNAVQHNSVRRPTTLTRRELRRIVAEIIG